MRILTILGSPRSDGNTAHVLAWAEQALKSETHLVERVNLSDLRIDACRECLGCRKDYRALCLNIEDDANALVRKIIKCDAMIIASPVFCWGFPSHLKAMIDRLYCTVGDYETNPNYSTLLMNKRMGLLLTCGGPEEGNAELVIRGFYAMTRFMKAHPVGHTLFPFMRDVSSLTALDRQRTVDFALQMAAEL